MAERARAKAKKKTAKGGKIRSRGKVAELPASALKARKGSKHNGPPGMTDDQIADWQGKLDRSYKKVTDAQDEVRTMNGVYRSMLKAAGKEGFDKQAYIEARTLDKEDHGHVQVRYANIGRYLKVRGSNLATQMDLFQIDLPEIEDEAPAVRGLRAGRAGDDRAKSNPYKPGSEDFEAFDSNWLTGQKEIANRMAEGSGATH